MGSAKAVFWLGRLDDEGHNPSHQKHTHPAADNPAHAVRVVTQPSGLDRQVIDDAIRLFDEAFVFFDRRGDIEAQRMIDALALSLVNLIREHFIARQRH